MTVRTNAELRAIFADQMEGQVTPEFFRDLLDSISVFAEIGAAPKAAVNIGTTYRVVPLDVEGVSVRRLAVDTANNGIFNDLCDMEVEVYCEVWFKGANGRLYNFAVQRITEFGEPGQGAPAVVQRLVSPEYRILNASQVAVAVWSATIKARDLDAFQMVAKADQAASSFELLRGVMRIRRMGFE